MTIKALTRAQRDAVAELVRRGRIEGIASGGDVQRALSFLANATEAFRSIASIDSPLVRPRSGLCRDARRERAMLAAYGYRTARGEGQHEAAASFLAGIFNQPPRSDAALRMDDVRRNRNDRYYRAHTPTAAAAELAVKDARVLIDAARERLGASS